MLCSVVCERCRTMRGNNIPRDQDPLKQVFPKKSSQAQDVPGASRPERFPPTARKTLQREEGKKNGRDGKGSGSRRSRNRAGGLRPPAFARPHGSSRTRAAQGRPPSIAHRRPLRRAGNRCASGAAFPHADGAPAFGEARRGRGRCRRRGNSRGKGASPPAVRSGERHSALPEGPERRCREAREEGEGRFRLPFAMK